MKTLEDVMDKSWKKSRGQNRTERLNEVAEAIRSYYLSLLPEVKSCMCPKTDMECGHAQWDRGHNHCRGEMEKRIKG